MLPNYNPSRPEQPSNYPAVTISNKEDEDKINGAYVDKEGDVDGGTQEDEVETKDWVKDLHEEHI